MAPPKNIVKPGLVPTRNTKEVDRDVIDTHVDQGNSKKSTMRDMSMEKRSKIDHNKQPKPSLTKTKENTISGGRSASKEGASRLPPQNVKPLHPPKPQFSEKLVKPPKSGKPSIQPTDPFLDSRAPTHVEKLPERQSELAPKPRLDPQIPKLLEKVKKLTDLNAKLANEKSTLEAEVALLRNTESLIGEGTTWSEKRDRAIKAEMLRLRAENYRLRSSVQLNDRFGELISRAALDSEAYAKKCLELLQGNDVDEYKASMALGDIMNHVFRLNSILKNAQTDFFRLKEERGAKNTELWDNNFSSSEVHSTQNLTENVLQVLLDQESTFFSSLEVLKMKEFSEGTEMKILHDIITASCQALLSKSLLLSSYFPTKKSSTEIKKKLKVLSGLNFSQKIIKLESNLKENMKNFEIVDDLAGPNFLKADLYSLCKLDSSETPEAATSRISCLLTVMTNLIETSKTRKMAEKLQEITERCLGNFDQAIGAPIRELINFLDRTGFCHEVYLGYRYRLLSAVDSILAHNNTDENGWIDHLQRLNSYVKEVLETVKMKS